MQRVRHDLVVKHKRLGRTLQNNQGIKPKRTYNNCKNIFNRHRYTSIQRQIPTTIKGEINSNTITVGDFNAPVSAMDRSSRENLIRKHKL